jgi:membrane associated rhomboid family serine protease
MFPLRDNIDARTLPIVTWILIGINVAIFILELSLDAVALDQLAQTFGMIPARLNLDEPLTLLQEPRVLLTLVTSQFLHAGWLHLISNMWILFIFGDNVEDLMGKGRYLVFYLLSGVAANLTQAFVFPESTIPAVGASGAIAGVLGAYILLFPHARVMTMVIIFLFPWLIQIPAIVFLGVWFILQLYSGLVAVNDGMGGIAWWAHIGGFVFGLATVFLFARRRRR